MLFEILYYKGVMAEIASWDAADKARYLRITDMMPEQGPSLGKQYTKHLDKGLFEVRAGQGRVLYCTESEGKIIMLLAFKKKRNAIPARHLKTARARMKTWTSNLEK